MPVLESGPNAPESVAQARIVCTANDCALRVSVFVPAQAAPLRATAAITENSAIFIEVLLQHSHNIRVIHDSRAEKQFTFIHHGARRPREGNRDTQFGIINRKVDPLDTSDSTHMRPPYCSTMR